MANEEMTLEDAARLGGAAIGGAAGSVIAGTAATALGITALPLLLPIVVAGSVYGMVEGHKKPVRAVLKYIGIWTK